MPAKTLKSFLDKQGVKYVSIRHSAAYTAPEIAASAHVSGRDFAKTVMVMIEDELVMIVLPSNRQLVLSELRDMLDTNHVRLASESEFKEVFPDCEVGAMPPFGNLYKIKTYVTANLADEAMIAFNAGTHTEVIELEYFDFERLVNPTVLDFVTT
jgi:Ala-tRNA(Pro) deacylase